MKRIALTKHIARLQEQNKALLHDMQELHSNDTLLKAKIQSLTEKLRRNNEELLHEKDKLHIIDKQLRVVKEKLHGTAGNCLNHMVADFRKIQEALGKQYRREKLRDNETQELQPGRKT
jgi:chromosome segregation ATPase